MAPRPSLAQRFGRARRALLAPYHYLLAALAAAYYRYPARRLTVIGVTGTKGKSTVAEMLHAILMEAGHKSALAGTIRFAIGEESRPNLYKMTLPGRGFIQGFLHRALRQGCTHAVVEITSEAAVQHRHLALALDALIFTNLEPEHIESHGSLANYFAAKLAIGRALERSPKRPRAVIATSESEYGRRFLALAVEERIPFSFAQAEHAVVESGGIAFDYEGQRFALSQPGRFSVVNALAAIKAAAFLGVPLAASARALGRLARIAGRAERIEVGQPFEVIVDYAHTPGSLTALYEAFRGEHAPGPRRRLLCVLGSTGGGRDRWKRPEMAKIAERYCDEVILTNEDPYDEDPRAIVEEMAAGMQEKKPQIIMDRRAAVRAALAAARPGDAVLITGKGTDPFIMGARGSKQLWSDSAVAREELEKLGTI
ncbi:MAG TPA: UDP-N-acetylmuramyl-tripeptide synthetase [Candidatus Paceibacterota bacterium]|nr:UDP-N-acetylmuramyl-tripeptide synthetase [Candidatus Paceibacterota bacterium]